MKFNGHVIPAALAESITNGEWVTLSKSQRLPLVFPDSNIVHPSFYEVETMKLENANWPQESDPVYLGSKNADTQPGNIDPQMSVLIADLGPDRPIALDYRSGVEPSVVHLSEDDKQGWVEVAPNIETFLRKLLEEVSSA